MDQQRLRELEISQAESNANFQHMVKSVDEMTQKLGDLTETIIETNAENRYFKEAVTSSVAEIKIEVESTRNELIEEIDRLSDKFAKVDGRLTLIELADAGQKGQQQERSKHVKFWNDNWFKILTVLIMLSGFVGLISKVNDRIQQEEKAATTK